MPRGGRKKRSTDRNTGAIGATIVGGVVFSQLPHAGGNTKAEYLL